MTTKRKTTTKRTTKTTTKRTTKTTSTKRTTKKDDTIKIFTKDFEIYTWYEKSINGIFIQVRTINKPTNKSLDKLRKFLKNEMNKTVTVKYLKSVITDRVYFVFNTIDETYTKKYWNTSFIKKLKESL